MPLVWCLDIHYISVLVTTLWSRQGMALSAFYATLLIQVACNQHPSHMTPDHSQVCFDAPGIYLLVCDCSGVLLVCACSELHIVGASYFRGPVAVYHCS